MLYKFILNHQVVLCNILNFTILLMNMIFFFNRECEFRIHFWLQQINMYPQRKISICAFEGFGGYAWWTHINIDRFGAMKKVRALLLRLVLVCDYVESKVSYQKSASILNNN